MDMRTGRSIFDPYYSRIQELLFSGMSIKATYDCMEKYFRYIAHIIHFGDM